MELSKEEKEIIFQIKDLIKDRESFISGNLEDNKDSEFVKDKMALEGILNLIEKYKRLAKANLKDSEEFKNNMCEHRCILKSENIELKEAIEKQSKVIDEIYNLFYEFINRCPGSGMHLLQENGFDTTKCDENKCDNENCKECIKQYFYGKVEEENE